MLEVKPEMAETAMKQLSASLQKHLLGGFTIDMPVELPSVGAYCFAV